MQMPPPAQMPQYVPPPLWFVEGSVGGSWGWLNDLKFLNPDGTAFTLSPTDGNFILLSNKSPADTSWTAGASVGYFVSSQFFVTLSYQYFGKFQASGFALFLAGNFRQDLKTTAQGLLVGLGWDVKTGGTIFIEPTIAVGAGLILIPGAPLWRILVLSQVANGVWLPIVLIFMILLVNRRDLMGEQVNSRTFNVVAWGTSLAMIALTLILVYFGIFHPTPGGVPGL